MPYVSTSAKLGYGTLFGKSDNGSPPTFTTIAEVVSISGPGQKRDKIDATFMESAAGAREYIYALLDAGEITLDLNFIPNDTTQKGYSEDIVASGPSINTYRIAWPSGFDSQSLTATVAADIWTTTAHGFNTPQPVNFTTTGTLPAGLTAGKQYYARRASNTTFTLFATSADAVANTNQITGETGGSGVHTVNSAPVWTFSALVTGIEPGAKVEDKLAATVTFQVTGIPTLP